MRMGPAEEGACEMSPSVRATRQHAVPQPCHLPGASCLWRVCIPQRALCELGPLCLLGLWPVESGDERPVLRASSQQVASGLMQK